MQFVFGPGNLIATSLTDAYGNVIANPTPRQLGAFQEASFDASAENKMLYGPNQYPLGVGRGTAKVGLKVKAAQISNDKWNALYIVQPANQSVGVLAAYIDTQGTAIPATPYQITPVTTMPHSCRVRRRRSITTWVCRTATATPTRECPRAHPPGSTHSSGVHIFAAADTTKLVFISFAYTATNASGAKNAFVNVSNIAMGQAPFMQVNLSCSYGGNPLLVTLFNAIASKLSLATKLDDFAVPDIEFDGFANSSNVAYRIAARQ